jgi:hypothetical protein
VSGQRDQPEQWVAGQVRPDLFLLHEEEVSSVTVRCRTIYL